MAMVNEFFDAVSADVKSFERWSWPGMDGTRNSVKSHGIAVR